MKKLILRGVQFRHIDMLTNDNAAFVRCHMEADISPALAARMNWEIYQEGHLIGGLEGTTKLIGELYLDGFTFKTQAAGSIPALESPAVTADDFKLTRKKGTAEGSIETSLRFIISSTSWEPITKFFGNLGQIKGGIALNLKPETEKLQQELPDGDPGEPDDEPEDPKPRVPRGTLSKLN